MLVGIIPLYSSTIVLLQTLIADALIRTHSTENNHSKEERENTMTTGIYDLEHVETSSVLSANEQY